MKKQKKMVKIMKLYGLLLNNKKYKNNFAKNKTEYKTF